MPSFDLVDLSDVSLTKQVVTPSDEEINATIERMASANRPFHDRMEGQYAETGDRVVINFTGRIDGVAEYVHRRVRSVTVAAPGIVSYADGERFGALPLTVECAPGALQVLA